MVINKRIANVSFTEIYAGGGNFLTQSGRVRHHVFFEKKILSKGESADAWREVTPSEREVLEAEDATFVEASEVLIAIWEDAVGKWGCFNRDTRFGELNGVNDLTVPEMVAILQAGYPLNGDAVEGFYQSNTKIRTNIPVQNRSAPQYGSKNKECSGCKSLEVFNGVYQSYGSETFKGCSSLKKIMGRMYGTNAENSFKDAFVGCVNLEDISGLSIASKANYNFGDCPRLSYSSVESLAKSVGSDRTLTFHPHVYAALTGEASEYPFNGGSREKWIAIFENAVSRGVIVAAAEE